MTDRRPLPELVRTAFLLVMLWTIFAAFNCSEVYLLAVDTGYKPNQALVPIVCDQLSAALMWALFTPLIAYLAERLPLVQPFRWWNALALVAATPVLAVVRAGVGAFVMQIVEGSTSPPVVRGFVMRSIEIRFHRNVFLVLVIVGIVNLILAHRAAASSERNAFDRKRSAANAQLQRLRAVVQPQFLFATLDTVQAQVARDPRTADRMLVRLGTVLRRMLEFEKRGDVSLREELQLVEHCLELERTRTRGRFTTAVRVDSALHGVAVPPLLLQTLIEGALVVEGPEEGHLDIDVWVDGAMLRIDIRTSDVRRAPADAAIETTRARLRRAYADRAQLERSVRAQGSLTTVVLPLTPPSPAGDWTFPECRAQ